MIVDDVRRETRVVRGTCTHNRQGTFHGNLADVRPA
jgi:hypothetical protein